MKKVRKKEEKIIYAYRLGSDSEMERIMVREGKIRKTAAMNSFPLKHIMTEGNRQSPEIILKWMV